MVKNTTSQARPDWPTSSQRVRKRRESKVTYHNNAKLIHRNGPAGSTTVLPLGTTSSRPNVHAHAPVSPVQPVKSELLDLYDFQGLSATYYDPSQQVDQTGLWYQPSSTTYTLPSRPPNSPQTVESGFPAQIRETEPSTYQSNPQLSWQKGVTHVPANYQNINNLISPTNSHFGSFDSFDSMGMPSGNTTASSVSDTYACLETNSFNPSDRSNQIPDLALSESYYQTKQTPYDVSPTSSINSNPGVFPFEGDFNSDMIMSDWSLEEQYAPNDNRWSQLTVRPMQNQNDYSGNTPMQSHSPWNSQSVHNNGFGSGALAGAVAFEPARGTPYDTYLLRQQLLDANNQVIPEVYAPEPSPILESENEWQVVPSIVPSYPNSSIRSHESPRSEGSPWTHVDSPPASSASPQSQPDQHYHILHAHPALSNPKLQRGRQRALTSQEKKEALDVRKAKACWACHLSKIKCSPCSPGSPCQQCERLDGKRRFCWLPCFNDPLESLITFMSPDYLNSGFTQAKVEWYISQNVVSWGNQEMLVQMNWGYWKPLEARVVALTLSENSGLAYQHQSRARGSDKPLFFKKKSPPVGIPLASMYEMQEQYCTLVQEIVTSNPSDYVNIAYNGQASDLPRRLLQVVSAFYSAGLAAGDECESLRQVLEVHVVETILERSLRLDETSMRQVEHHLRQQFPPRSASRCMQRQIKLAFYEVQQKRIHKVLESWGAMMWTSSKNTAIEKKWTVSFSILLTLILIVDKTLESAYWFCESQIRNYDANPTKERAKFQELVRLTQTELFERCKEIFHSSFKTRKGGKEACNPIRDGIAAFRGKTVNEGISRFVWDIDEVMREYGSEIRSRRGSKPNEALHEHPYTNSGRLASVFLADFLDH